MAELGYFYLNTSIISRTKGYKACAAAAYRANTKIKDDLYSETHDYTRRRSNVFSKIYLPPSASSKFENRTYLWNAVEKQECNKNPQNRKNVDLIRANARVAREFTFALPNFLNREQQIDLINNLVKKTFLPRGVVVDCNIHQVTNPNKKQNDHVHLMVTTRNVEGDHLCKKIYEFDKKEFLLDMRKKWAEITTDFVKTKGFDVVYSAEKTKIRFDNELAKCDKRLEMLDVELESLEQKIANLQKKQEMEQNQEERKIQKWIADEEEIKETEEVKKEIIQNAKKEGLGDLADLELLLDPVDGEKIERPEKSWFDVSLNLEVSNKHQKISRIKPREFDRDR